ncbi:MAG: tetratricopeptide repeat protein [Rhizobiaceae bacterium]|nr:tetratricopeptide repeat protein [Rhizobiaceae bacterium]
MVTDVHGLSLSGANGDAVRQFEAAQHMLRCFIGDPVGAIDATLKDSPGFVMGHVFKGYLFGLATEPAATEIARAAHEAATTLPANAREKAHVAALGHLAAGRWHAAGQALEDIAIEHPRDALALQVGHQIDFFTGNAKMLRDRIARALPQWSTDAPGYHALLGMHAFGLEETGDYARAEATGRRAVELEPRDGWAQHSVAHVMEMQSRQRDGIAWMRANPDAWTNESFLQIHNWWHLGLFHYELGEISEVLALYDGPVMGGQSAVALCMVDASAMLWRLHLGGADTGGRWEPLADLWTAQAGGVAYAFNAAHAMMAFVGAGRQKAALELLEAQRTAMDAGDDNAGFTRDVGYPMARAILAFGDGDYAQTVRLLRPLRHIAHRFGGSHAQRDVIDLTLIEAAIRSGNAPLARALTAERADQRPESPLSGLFVKRAGEITPAI